MLDKENRHIKVVSDKADSLGKLRGFLRVHSGGRLVKEKQLRICRKRTCYFELSLLAVGEV